MLCNINERCGGLGHLLVAWALLMPSSRYIAYDRLLLACSTYDPEGLTELLKMNSPGHLVTSRPEVRCSVSPRSLVYIKLHCRWSCIVIFLLYLAAQIFFPSSIPLMGSSSQLSTKWQVSILASLSVPTGAFPALEPAQVWQTFMSLSTPKYGICCLRVQQLCFCERCKVKYFVL